ncbi:RICIN domain-containing protein [Kitasatospora sp. NPDC097643]|uniref:RICIN domain-containing protein n=1 Tax=Kitasatospora sp. NPDC097643 TaxID=3157230 RepID=UPI00331D7131
MSEPPRPLRRRIAALAALALGVATAVAVVPTAAAAPTTAVRSVILDGSSAGRAFDGLGAISGGGATSRLLMDYPEPQRSQVLDYLFKPGYGASLQLLKVEIGGDANTTDGPEPSHMRTPTEVDCNRGYEWWLMEQAKARNPGITFYGLEWSAPGWLNGGIWSQDNITYLESWLGCAQQHGLNVGYLGGWNERGYDKAWFEKLRADLDGHGRQGVTLVASDNDDEHWSVADDLAGDPAFAKAVGVVGVHGTCWHSVPVYTACPGSSTATGLGKRLWAVEDDNDSAGADPAALARNVNREYIDARITADIKWALVGSWPANLPYAGAGLMAADQPWSGNYTVGRDIWVMAHTAQFAKPGWQYLDGSSGYLSGAGANGDPHSGSYVTLRSGQDYSTVIESTDATTAQTLSLKVAGGLSTGPVHVWATDLRSTDPSRWFVHTQDVTPRGGSYSLTVQPGYLYTVTTTTGQGKGAAVPPAAAGMPLPYQADLSGYAAGATARYFHDWAGAFETAPCPAGATTPVCLRQVITRAPIPWHDDMNYTPLTLMGDPGWTHYRASTDVSLEQAGSSAELLGRIDHVDHDRSGYHLKIDDTGAWSLFSEDRSGTDTVLASGSYPGAGAGTWHNLTLAVQGQTITASIDHSQVASVADAGHGIGQIGLGVGGFQQASFANTTVAPLAAPATHTVTSVNSGKCLDVTGASTADGAQAVQWTCGAGQAGQQWSLVPVAGTGTVQLVSANSGKCLDVTGASTADGAQVIQWTCGAGKANQQWTLVPTLGARVQLVSANSGKCLDVTAASTADGAQVIQWTCGGAGRANQEWTVS